jgi:hypothetical protein
LPENFGPILHSSFPEKIRSCWTHDPNVGNFFFVMHVTHMLTLTHYKHVNPNPLQTVYP